MSDLSNSLSFGGKVKEAADQGADYLAARSLKRHLLAELVARGARPTAWGGRAATSGPGTRRVDLTDADDGDEEQFHAGHLPIRT